MSVREYLESLKWDGKPRIASFFTDYATGTNAFNATKWFVSAVARAMKPGCNITQNLVLCGPEGAGKTKLLRALFGESPNNGGYADEMSKCWIVEVEFDLLLSTNKAFLTARHDTYRFAYMTELETSARTCIIVATDNNTKRITKSLKSGTRRFWHVNITACAAQKIAIDRDQLWAEAKYLFGSGVQWWD